MNLEKELSLYVLSPEIEIYICLWVSVSLWWMYLNAILNNMIIKGYYFEKHVLSTDVIWIVLSTMCYKGILFWKTFVWSVLSEPLMNWIVLSTIWYWHDGQLKLIILFDVYICISINLYWTYMQMMTFGNVSNILLTKLQEWSMWYVTTRKFGSKRFELAPIVQMFDFFFVNLIQFFQNF